MDAAVTIAIVENKIRVFGDMTVSFSKSVLPDYWR
jgi:hypothetical protein